MRIFCKRFSHFSNKNLQCICNIYVLDFNETLTNDTTGPGTAKASVAFGRLRGNVLPTFLCEMHVYMHVKPVEYLKSCQET